MITIWKFPVEAVDVVRITMPQNSKLLHIGTQPPGSRDAYVWALVDTELPPASRRLAIIGTGNPALHVHGYPYVGTFMLYDEVFHAFDLGERPLDG